MKIVDLLNSTKPIIFETGVVEYSYAFAGTCFQRRNGYNRLVGNGLLHTSGEVEYSAARLRDSVLHQYGSRCFHGTYSVAFRLELNPPYW